MKFLKKHIFLILAISFTFFALMALFHPGFFPIHDDEQIGRLHELNYDLVTLHIPPRLSQNLGFGYDYPFFNFYPPFVYYFAEIFKVSGFSYIDSTKIMIAFGFIFSAIFMYLFSKEYFGKLGGLVSAVLYIYAPYHSVDVYVRGALPEFWTFVFIPAIFWSMLRLQKNLTYRNILILGLFFAGLMLTHNLVFMMAVPFIAIYFFYLLYETNDRKTFFFTTILSGILALLLSSYFWIPAILENKFTMVGLLTQQLADYNLHFVSLRQFLDSPWGYGGSILGPNDGLSLEVGKIHLILLAISSLSFVYLWIKKKNKELILIPFIFMFVLSLFLQSYYSKIVWDHLNPLSYIQFPWRFMLLSVFSSSFIAGYIFSIKFDEKIKKVLAGVLIVVVILFYAPLFKPSQFLVNAKDEDYVSQDVLRWKTSSMAFEYVPKGVATRISNLGTTVVDINQNQIAKETATVLSGNMDVAVLEDLPHYKKLEVVVLDSGKLQINTYSFPGWKVFINGRQISYNDRNKLRLITINVENGTSIVEAKFTDTQVRKFADILSIVGIFMLLALLFFYSKKVKL